MKAGEAVGQNVISLFGDFDPQLYEDYHLFMIDASYGTGSEAYMEERLSEQLAFNLAGGGHLFRLELRDLQVSERSGFIEENYAALKKQIHDYCGYAMTEGVLDMIKRHNEEGRTDKTAAGQAGDTKEDIVLPDTDRLKDPRNYISSFTGDVLLRFVCPKDRLPSTQILDLSDMPSKSQGITDEGESLPDNLLEDGVLDKLMNGAAFDIDGLTCPKEHLELIFYVSSVFHSYASEDKTRVLQGEQEYILYGEDSDKKNMLCTVGQIILFRMPFNYLYLKSNAGKQVAMQSAAVVLSAASQTSVDFMYKALMGVICFGESVLDTRALLHGEAVALKKTDDTWKLSLSDLFLNKLKGNGKADGAKGLYYEDYLMLLMLKKISVHNMYGRILDVITLNRQIEQPAFSVQQGMTKATVSYQIECQSRFSSLPKNLTPNAYLFFFDRGLEY